MKGGELRLAAWEEKIEASQAQTTTKAVLLERWDKSDALLAESWSRISPERFHAVESAFGLPPGPNREYVLYLIDNEVHHRAQGFVYLRLLGLEPPAFWER